MNAKKSFPTSRGLVVWMLPACMLLIPTASAYGEYLVAGTGNNGGVNRYDLATGASNGVLAPSTNRHVADVAVDSVNDRIYWFQSQNDNKYFQCDDDPANPGGVREIFHYNDNFTWGYSVGHIDVDPMTDKAALQYQQNGGPRSSPLRSPDTWIEVLDLTTGVPNTIYAVDMYVFTGWVGIANPGPTWKLIHDVEDVAIDPVRRKVYWADSAAGTISRRNIDGSGAVDVLYQGLLKPTHLALDVGAQQIYFTDLGDASTPAGIHCANMDGLSSVTAIITGLADLPITSMDIDPLNDKIYWGEYDWEASRGYARRADYDGTNVEDVLDASDNVIDGRTVAIDLAAGATPRNPLLPDSSGDGFDFDDVLVPDHTRMLFFDPDYAIGYDYSVVGPNFASVLLPQVGDGLFDLYLWSGGVFVFDRELTAGVEFTFAAGGVNRFRIFGIEESAELDPDDPMAFLTGLSFTAAGTADVTMTAYVPEPSTISLLLAAGLARLTRRRRKVVSAR